MSTEAELAGADDAAVAAARDRIIAYLADRYPTAAVRGGQLSDLIVLPGADGLAAVEARADAVTASSDPETALAEGGYDEDVLAAVLAGRGVSRAAAAAAVGSVAVHLSSYVGVTVPAGYRVRTADGVYYQTTAAARVLAPGTETSSAGEAAAVAVPGGGYAVVVAAAAAESGAAANRPAGTALTADNPLAAQTAVYAATDFAGGADEESDAELLARLPAATAARTVASAAGAAAVVATAYAYSGVAVVGFGHEGMRRGRTGLTGQSPGRVDVRVRSDAAPTRVRVPVTATLVDTVPFGRWRFTLGVADAPGRHRVEKVIQRAAALAATGYAPESTAGGFDTTAAAAPVDIRVSDDATLSTYATLTVEFFDTATSTAGMTVGVTTRSYDAVCRAVPGLADAQAAVEDPDARSAGGDCLVRAAVPVDVTLTAQAAVAAGVTLTADEVAAAVARAVNENPVSQSVSASAVAARAATHLPAGTALTLTGWAGSVYSGIGSPYSVTGTTGLSVATDWSRGVGPDAVAFYCDTESVAASVSSAD